MWRLTFYPGLPKHFLLLLSVLCWVEPEYFASFLLQPFSFISKAILQPEQLLLLSCIPHRWILYNPHTKLKEVHITYILMKRTMKQTKDYIYNSWASLHERRDGNASLKGQDKEERGVQSQLGVLLRPFFAK